MIGTIRKHSTGLWLVIIVVTVIAFVFWGTPTGQDDSGPSGKHGRINGKNISDTDFINARNEVRLRYFFRTREWPDSSAAQTGFDVVRETYSLLLLNQILDERQMFAGPEAKAHVARNILGSLGQQGITTLKEFETAILAPEGLNLADLDHFIEHQIAMLQLTSVEGLQGKLVTPQLIESLYRRENQELSAQAVFFSASNYLNSVVVTPEAVSTFFTNQMSLYRIPERVQVSYVAYPISNYQAKADQRLDAMTNLTAQIEAQYLQLGTNYFGADTTPEEAKAEILEEYRQQAAAFEARRDAAGFADLLMRTEPMLPSNMNDLAGTQGLTVQISEPFDRESVPEGLDVNMTFTETAFRLREDEPFSGPIEGDDHVYIITTHSRLPSEDARFDEVRDEVTERYRMQQATLEARAEGRAFVTEATNKLASGTAFTQICADAGVKPVLLPSFSKSTQSMPEVEAHTAPGFFKQIAFSTPVGSLSPFNFTADGGYVVYPQALLPIDEVKMKEELPRYTTLVSQTLQGEAFEAWFRHQAETGLRDTPLNRAPPPEMAAPGG